MKWKPDKLQLKALEFLLTRQAAALLLDPGAGKTSISYAAFKLLKSEKQARRALVVSPRRPARLVWPLEAEKWDDFRDFNICLLNATARNMHGDRLLEEKHHDIYVINPEGLEWLCAFPERVKRLRADTLIVDELSKFKNMSTNRMRALKPFLDSFQRKWGLTGSPAPEGLLDLFGQMYLLDGGYALGAYITHYRNQYFDKTGFGGFNYVLKKKAEKLIYKRIKELALRVELPKRVMPLLVENNIYIDLPDYARKVYKEMDDEYFALVGSDEIDAASAGVARLRCREITSGAVYNGRGKKQYSRLHEEKYDAVAELFEELQGQHLLVFYWFAHELEALRERFPEAVVLEGSDSKVLRLEAEWNQGHHRMLLAQPQSAGHGLNLQHGGYHVVYTSLPESFELYDQSMRRLWRRGQPHHTVYVHRILANDTVDVDITWSLKRKSNTQEELFAALRKRRR